MKIERSRAGKARGIAVLVIIVSAAIVGYMAWANANYAPDTRAAHEFEAMVKDYYENYFYDQFLSDYVKENGEGFEIRDAFEPYTKSGFPRVMLRKLLLFDDGRWEDKREVFDNDQYVCDTNTSYVKITPVAPFSKTDYHTEYDLDCKIR